MRSKRNENHHEWIVTSNQISFNGLDTTNIIETRPLFWQIVFFPRHKITYAITTNHNWKNEHNKRKRHRSRQFDDGFTMHIYVFIGINFAVFFLLFCWLSFSKCTACKWINIETTMKIKSRLQASMHMVVLSHRYNRNSAELDSICLLLELNRETNSCLFLLSIKLAQRA